ncbi:MAG: DUF488 domain-containing protein [Clostridiaceae bacterium]|nr:DUF488 domain-containing protein [Clostridiaceae bacterium]
MGTSKEHIIYTIGHSTHSIDEFIAMLQSFGIKQLVDIRSLPGSTKFPQFNKENLEILLPEAEIRYIYMKELGGRRKVRPDSKNTRWKNISFRGYADYMETEAFTEAIGKLEKIALQAPTVYMCAEAVWWRCHRSMVSDFLTAKGWKVMHIMGVNKVQEHTYTSRTKVFGSCVSYED